MERLTDVAYWDENWWTQKRPERLRLYRDFDFETVRLLGKAAGDAAQAGRPRVLELGAGGSRVLPYLARRFGYAVVGCDFSWRGCRLLRSNLELARVRGGIVCEDVFHSALAPGQFDLVYSSGLVEHFDDTRAAVAEHLRHVRPGGRLALIVPNFQGVQGRIWKRLAPALHARHRVFGPQDLAGILSSLGLGRICSGYLGSFFIHVGRDPDWSGVRTWPAALGLLVHRSVRLVNGFLSLGFRLSPWRPHSRALSPAFFALGTKSAL
ncbi:MAG TPA: class I SAM-dependent methyltransferase [Terriglobia bacterium]|nr:class I SAM-dependent methyltransferase [Terriglobia bacterium]